MAIRLVWRLATLLPDAAIRNLERMLTELQILLQALDVLRLLHEGILKWCNLLQCILKLSFNNPAPCLPLQSSLHRT